MLDGALLLLERGVGEGERGLVGRATARVTYQESATGVATIATSMLHLYYFFFFNFLLLFCFVFFIKCLCFFFILLVVVPSSTQLRWMHISLNVAADFTRRLEDAQLWDYVPAATWH